MVVASCVIGWLAIDSVLVGWAYLRNDPRVFGKRRDGTRRTRAMVVLLPMLGLVTGVWWLARLGSRRPAVSRLGDHLWLGRRLTASEVPSEVMTIVDLTCELTDPSIVRARDGYLCLPILDVFAPRLAELCSLVDRVAAMNRPLIHCAQGYGRTGLVAAAVLLRRGLVSTPEQALAWVCRARPGVRLSRLQLRALHDYGRSLATALQYSEGGLIHCAKRGVEQPRYPIARMPESRNPKGLTRRGLFRSIGTATLVAGCVAQEPPSKQPDAKLPDPGIDGAFGLSPAPLAFVLDGQPVERAVEARTTLLELLRLDLDRTGTKLVCDRGACGACMVLVDKVPRNACMLLAHDVAGAEVTTVAGLAQGDRLSPLQYAFVEHDALQCGFCTSGMLVSATALLDRQQQAGNAKLDRSQVADALAGNLCRCGTYPHVIDAVLAIANHETAVDAGVTPRPLANTDSARGKHHTELIQVRR